MSRRPRLIRDQCFDARAPSLLGTVPFASARVTREREGRRDFAAVTIPAFTSAASSSLRAWSFAWSVESSNVSSSRTRRIDSSSTRRTSWSRISLSSRRARALTLPARMPLRPPRTRPQPMSARAGRLARTSHRGHSSRTPNIANACAEPAPFSTIASTMRIAGTAASTTTREPSPGRSRHRFTPDTLWGIRGMGHWAFGLSRLDFGLSAKERAAVEQSSRRS
jgi:hypothetical protein